MIRRSLSEAWRNYGVGPANGDVVIEVGRRSRYAATVRQLVGGRTWSVLLVTRVERERCDG